MQRRRCRCGPASGSSSSSSARTSAAPSVRGDADGQARRGRIGSPAGPSARLAARERVADRRARGRAAVRDASLELAGAVPSATMRPPSTTAIRSASRVGLLEVLRREKDRHAAGGEPVDHVPHPLPAAGIEAGRRLVEEHRPRGRRRARRRCRAAGASRPSRCRPDDRRPPSRSNRSSSSSARAVRRAVGSRRSRPIIPQVLPPGLQLVERGVLAGEADSPPHLVPLANDVEAADPRAAASGCGQRGEDAHGRGLAGAVRAEQREHRPARDVEIDAGKDRGRPEAWSARWSGLPGKVINTPP